MLSTPSDESAHSFILRHHMVYGIPDVSNVVCKRGYWVKQPGVLRNTVHLYQYYEESHLLKLAINSYTFNYSRSIFGNPRRFLSQLDEVFYRGRSSSKKSGDHEIKFCPKCISEQIRLFGFGYFKYNWLHQDFCVSHKQKLRGADYPLSDPYNYLQKVLSGRLYCSLRESKTNNYYEEVEPLKLVAKASPCLAEAFQSWIRKRLYLIDEKVAEECGVGCRERAISWFLHDDGRFRTVHMSHLGLVLSAIRSIHSSEYFEFIQHHSKTIMVPCGIKSHNSVSVPYIIYKEKDCRKCTDSACPISSVISVFRDGFFQKVVDNPCDELIKREYRSKMEQYFFGNKA